MGHLMKREPSLASNVEISVIIPLFNEQESVPYLLEKLLVVLDTLGRRFEIITVNDGSNDKSAVELATAAATRPEI